jgi:hypothetical protein
MEQLPSLVLCHDLEGVSVGDHWECRDVFERG